MKMFFYPIISRLVPASAEYDLLKENLNEEQNEAEKKTIESIWYILSVLDAKASALMRLDGVVLAAAFVGIAANIYELKSIPFIGIAFPSIVSMLLCLIVVGVDWPFLGYAKKDDFALEITHLRKVRYFRERIFQWAWLFAFLSGMVLLIFLSWKVAI